MLRAARIPPATSNARATSVSFGHPSVVHTASTTAIKSVTTPTNSSNEARID